MARPSPSAARGAQPPQPHAPPQQPPPAEPLALVARPPTEIVDSNLTVSSWPCGQVAGRLASLIGLVCSKVAPQERHRYSYRGTRPG
ncbi:hypothetical protein DFJ64_0764 [Thermasporomyces composti]|uniref:Uncharacterized protein n=1 Tax=Thermasporomyces composti TaxID=696763 RepID=A0A3D9V8R1_THECX|nr:hypothetical protein DFJ64_0764 [Thermasporomyces composti]